MHLFVNDLIKTVLVFFYDERSWYYNCYEQNGWTILFDTPKNRDYRTYNHRMCSIVGPSGIKLNTIYVAVDRSETMIAVREAFTNSIIHADMMLEAGVLRIEKHEDRLVFRNPGLLMLPLKEIYEGGVSKARNPKMQNMLRMIGYGENLGSGFPMILSACKQAGWAEPVLENRLEVDEVSLVLPIKRIEGSAPKSAPKSALKIGPKSGSKNRKSGPKKLSPQERLDMIITLVRNEPLITRENICEILGVGLTTLRKDLRILKEQYGVHYEGSSKTGEWVIDN